MAKAEPENPALVHLRRIDQKIDRLSDGRGDLTIRKMNGEADLSRDRSLLDRLGRWVDRIEHRFDLVEAHGW